MRGGIHDLYVTFFVDHHFVVSLLVGFKEQVLDGDVNEIRSAKELCECPLEQERGGGDGDEAKHERANQPVGKRPLLLVFRQPLGEQPEYQSVVDRQDSL